MSYPMTVEWDGIEVNLGAHKSVLHRRTAEIRQSG